jgi:hypothetical protein
MLGHFASQRLERAIRINERASYLVLSAFIVQVILHLEYYLIQILSNKIDKNKKNYIFSSYFLDSAISRAGYDKFRANIQVVDLFRFTYFGLAKLTLVLIFKTISSKMLSFKSALIFKPTSSWTVN